MVNPRQKKKKWDQNNRCWKWKRKNRKIKTQAGKLHRLEHNQSLVHSWKHERHNAQERRWRRRHTDTGQNWAMPPCGARHAQLLYLALAWIGMTRPSHSSPLRPGQSGIIQKYCLGEEGPSSLSVAHGCTCRMADPSLSSRMWLFGKCKFTR